MTQEKICTECGEIGRPKRMTKGNLIFEILLWVVGAILAIPTFGIVLIIPLAYSIWRLTSRYRACRSCGSPKIISPDSPKGRSLSKKYQGR